MGAFALFGLGFLYFVGNSQLEEVLPSIQFFADSNTYIKTYRGDANNFEGSYVKIDTNYFGPIMILKIFQGNNYLVLLFNVCIFTLSVIHIAKILGINSFYVATLLLISPLTISSLLSVNKEIFLYPFLAFALYSYARKSLLLFLIALLLSIFVRWQLGVFCIIFFLIIIWRQASFSRAKVLLFMLMMISIAYKLMLPLIDPIIQYVQLSIENYQESGIGFFERYLEMQNNGLYFLIFPFKALHLLFGMGFKLDKIFNPVELYNDFFVGGHCAIAFAIFISLFVRKKLSLKSDLIYVAILYLIVFCLTPVFSPRYLYFVYILAVLVLAGAPFDLHEIKIRRRSKTILGQRSTL
jgi:hypothetical protein